MNVSKLPARPHVTAGAGGFVDITARARKIVFSGYFNAGAKLSSATAGWSSTRRARSPRSSKRSSRFRFPAGAAVSQGQDVTYVTERCVMKLSAEGLVVTEIAPGIDIRRDILARAIPLTILPDVKPMADALFRPEKSACGWKMRNPLGGPASCPPQGFSNACPARRIISLFVPDCTIRAS